ncbi:hypothetical protein ACFX2G_034906 [Malus domestica]
MQSSWGGNPTILCRMGCPLYATCDSINPARKLFDMSVYKDVVTGTVLINGYVKSGQVEAARELFDDMPDKNAVLWNAMINGYV